MLKNVAGQKILVFAYTRATGAPVLGDAANITCKVAIDNGTATALADVNPTETLNGFYLFDVTQAETNGNTLDFYPESATSGVHVIAAGHRRQTLVNGSADFAIPGEQVRVFAFDRVTGAPVLGDAANITCKVAIDYGAAVALADTNPTEKEDGFYLFSTTVAERTGDTLNYYPESSTSGVQVIVIGNDQQKLSQIGNGFTGFYGASYYGGTGSDAVDGTSLTIWAGSDYSQAVALSLPNTWSELFWTVKDGREIDENNDAKSIIQIKLTNGGDAGDGLLYLDRAVAADATAGSLAINDDRTEVTITLDHTATAGVTWTKKILTHDFAFHTSAGTKPYVVSPGVVQIRHNVTKTLPA